MTVTMSADHTSEPLTNLLRPTTSATLTIRIIKSFEFRTERSLVLHNVNLEATTIGNLKQMSIEDIRSQRAWRPYHNVELDTVKLYSKAHGAKTTNLIINLDHDDWIFDDDTKTLAELGFENETEVSFFNRATYEQFKANPETRWDA
ncbi:hypothetical protein HGRIS_013341 [Hohenbuehelia grisea]|uniref:Cytoplasmic protein n=1 Tax=Hohenbuehelia grisea TaxID=104357 RepID=A0ABR3IV58_9AGAR